MPVAMETWAVNLAVLVEWAVDELVETCLYRILVAFCMSYALRGVGHASHQSP